MKPQLKKKILFDEMAHVSILRKGKQPAPTDSPEVLYRHYCDTIRSLQTQLSYLNLLEHPCEIQAVCGNVILIKNKLLALAEKYKLVKK